MKASALAMASVVVISIFVVMPFLVGVTTSARYDPWYDLDENGEINIFDIVRIAGTYGTTGTPGKNVTVVRRSNNLAYSIEGQTVLSGTSFFTPWISIDGYSKVTICIYQSGIPISNGYWLLTRHAGGSTNFVVDSQSDFGSSVVKSYDVPNEQIRVNYYNGDVWDVSVYIDIYLIP